jgi:hypothetical protein
MARMPRLHSRNRSPYGWWIATEVVQFVPEGRRTTDSNRRFLVWENTRLIRAKDRDEAYEKAIEIGRAGMPGEADRGEWRFVGISVLLPIYEKLDDGAEIIWDDRGMMSARRIKSLVKKKRDLSVFDDRDD